MPVGNLPQLRGGRFSSNRSAGIEYPFCAKNAGCPDEEKKASVVAMKTGSFWILHPVQSTDMSSGLFCTAKFFVCLKKLFVLPDRPLNRKVLGPQVLYHEEK